MLQGRDGVQKALVTLPHLASQYMPETGLERRHLYGKVQPKETKVIGWKVDGVATSFTREDPRLEAFNDMEVSPIIFQAKQGRIYGNGKTFDIKGINWYGAEARTGTPGGLGQNSVQFYMKFLAANGFNAIRLPFNHQSILLSADPSSAPPLDTDGLTYTPELQGKTYIEMLVLLAQEAARHGILILLACHRLSPTAWPGSGLWYDQLIEERNVLESWEYISEAFCGQWNVFGVDLHNEPYAASWGWGRTSDWDKAAMRIGNHVLEKCARWLIFVEGVGYKPGAPGLNSEQQGALGHSLRPAVVHSTAHTVQLPESRDEPVAFHPQASGGAATWRVCERLLLSSGWLAPIYTARL